METQAIGLHQLNALVRQTLKNRFPETLWIVAEVADIKENRSGHCYLELVEKKEADDSLLASARATIWSFIYRTLKPYFETTTGKSLQKGMKILIRTEVVFHELYGYSLNIRDIDPSFTLGDLERKKREILERLQREGVIDMNRELPFPVLPKTVAVISSPTAAGYGDFTDQLHRNPYGYVFHTCLFPAVMQGEQTAISVVEALDRIYALEPLFDVVVMIRGGGSQADLGSFDSYELALNVAQFPLPVIAGIGHERDETIVDRVAFRSVKTPTAAAAFLLESFRQAEEALLSYREDFTEASQALLREEHQRQLLLMNRVQRSARTLVDGAAHRMTATAQKVIRHSKLLIQSKGNLLQQVKFKIEGEIRMGVERQSVLLLQHKELCTRWCRQYVATQRHLLEVRETANKFSDPRNILKRGFSITRMDGKAVRDVARLQAGDVVETEFFRGRTESKVTEKRDDLNEQNRTV